MSQSKYFPLCKDCKHLGQGKFNYSDCMRTVTTRRDGPVFGVRVFLSPLNEPAEGERKWLGFMTSNCGPHAKYFEAKV